ncbi:MAG: hypothetical protein M3Y66_07265, partial [Actinomycetota bacterium]|nr:hypothetical protein [Actinomycetota bacterium]
LVLDVVSISAGGSYWPHYLIQPIPLLALCLGWLGGISRAAVVGIAIASTVVTLVVGFQTTFVHPRRDLNTVLGSWVAGASAPGDTAIVLYGHADIQFFSGLRSPYESLWSLPIRTRDPDLVKLTRVLTSKDAPRFVVTADPPASMNLRARGFLTSLERNYVGLAPVCGRTILWVHRGETGNLPPSPRCAPGTRQPQWYVARWVTRLRQTVAGKLLSASRPPLRPKQP